MPNPPTTPETYGPVVPARRLREALGLRLVDVAERMTALGVPVALSTIARIEMGQTRTHPRTLRAYATALGLAPYEMQGATTAAAVRVPA